MSLGRSNHDVSVTVKKPDQLTAQEIERWRALLIRSDGFFHPQLQPEWAQLVAEAGLPVEVAVLEASHGYFGIFAFARHRSSLARPIGGELTDCHAILISPDADLDVRKLMKACGLKSWTFDHLPTGASWLSPYRLGVDPAFSIDLSSGFGEYWARLRERHASWCRQLERKRRKLACEVGELRFEWRSSEEGVLEDLIDWKQHSLQRSGLRNTFSDPQTQQLLRLTAGHESAHFSGWLSVLYAGKQRVAIHLGQRSGSDFNAWIPSYHPDYAKCSPGALLHIELLRSCVEQSVTDVDLGRGSNALKVALATGRTDMAIGAIDDRPLPKLLRRTRFMAANWARNSSYGRTSLQIYRRIRNS